MPIFPKYLVIQEGESRAPYSMEIKDVWDFSYMFCYDHNRYIISPRGLCANDFNLKVRFHRMQVESARQAILIAKLEDEIRGLKGNGAVWQCYVCGGHNRKTLEEMIEEGDDEEVDSMKKIQEEKDDKDNVINLAEARLALASKEPPEGGNWLSNLPFETRFLAYSKREPSPFLEDFLVATDPKKMPAVLVGYELAHKNGGFKWCDPVKFSRDYGLFMIIKTETEAHDGIEVQARRMDSDGKSEIVNPVHEE